MKTKPMTSDAITTTEMALWVMLNPKTNADDRARCADIIRGVVGKADDGSLAQICGTENTLFAMRAIAPGRCRRGALNHRKEFTYLGRSRRWRRLERVDEERQRNGRHGTTGIPVRGKTHEVGHRRREQNVVPW